MPNNIARSKLWLFCLIGQKVFKIALIRASNAALRAQLTGTDETSEQFLN